MQFLDFLVVISLISIGLLVFGVLKRFVYFTISLVDSALTSIIFSFSLICFPLIFLGVFQDHSLFKPYLLFLTIISLSFIMLYVLFKFPQLFTILNYYSVENSSFYKLVGVLSFIIIVTYFFHTIILPLRGYDALSVYFPDAMLFSQLGYIPPFNPLNFNPIIKEPLNSIIYAFSIYISNTIAVDLVILLIIFLWALVTYELTLLFFPGNHNFASLSSLMFLFFPLNLWFLDQWFYYQDIFLGFFFTSTIYFLLKSFQTVNTKQETIFYSVLSSLSFSLSLISKSSGWALILIIISVFLYYSQYQRLNKFYYISLFAILSLFSISNLFIGIIPFFLCLLLVVLYHASPNTQHIRQFVSSKLAVAVTLIFGTVLGGYWFLYIFNKFSFLVTDVTSGLFSFQIFLFSSPSDLNPSTISYTFESAHLANFFSLIFVLLLGNLFAVFWALPKVLALFKKSEVSILIIWTIIFFVIWLTFDFVSIRYLTPIISPLIIVTLYGFVILKSKIENLVKNQIPAISQASNTLDTSFSTSWIVVILFLGILSLYLPVSLNVFASLDRNAIATAYLDSAYIYYSNWFIVLVLLIVLPVGIYYLYKKNYLDISKFNNIQFFKSKKIMRFVFAFMILSLFIFPNIVLFDVFASTNFNISETQQLYIYDVRPEVQELISIINSENDPNAAIMVYDTPGLPLTTGHPTIDIYYAKDILKPIFSTSNVTRGLEILLNPFSYIASVGNYSLPSQILLPAIDYIVIPNKGNLYFNSFMNDFRNDHFLFGIIQNPHYFHLIYENSNFLLFKRIFTKPNYTGLVDLGLEFNTTQIPILGNIPQKSNLPEMLTGYAKLYFLNHLILNLQISVQTTILINNKINVLNDTLNADNITTDFFGVNWNLPLTETFSITNVSISLVVFTKQSTYENYSWSFHSLESMNIISFHNNTYDINLNDGLSYDS